MAIGLVIVSKIHISDRFWALARNPPILILKEFNFLNQYYPLTSIQIRKKKFGSNYSNFLKGVHINLFIIKIRIKFQIERFHISNLVIFSEVKLTENIIMLEDSSHSSCNLFVCLLVKCSALNQYPKIGFISFDKACFEGQFSSENVLLFLSLNYYLF